MRRLLLTVMFAVSFSFALPAPAHAWWHWLDELTGPGPFGGPDIQWRLVCLNDSLPEAGASVEKRERDIAREEFFRSPTSVQNKADYLSKEKALQTAVKAIRKRSDPGDYVLRSIESFGDDGSAKRWLAGIFGAGCAFQPKKNPVASLNFRVAYLASYGDYAKPNYIDFGSKPTPGIRMWEPELSYSVFVDRKKMVELGAGAGLSHASIDGGESISRLYLKPIILTVTPVPLVRRNGNAEIKGRFLDRVGRATSISSSLMYYRKGFTAADFGATGTYTTSRELVGTIGLVFDFSRY